MDVFLKSIYQISPKFEKMLWVGEKAIWLILGLSISLTLREQGGGVLRPPLAKSGPVHQGFTFKWP